MNKKAFTLMEILVVIVIISILGIITVPNVLEYFHESKIKAMLVQENKLVESGDILVRDFCKKPINDNYRLQCDEVFKSLNSTAEENVVDDDPLTYTKYICVSTLKDKKYYSEKLQYSGEECSGVVVYRIDEETDIQKDSFSVIKCGSVYKTLFENESVEEFEENPEDKTRADELIAVFKECFPAGSDEEEEEPSNTPKEYQLTINFTEHNQYGQQVAETISEKVLQGNSVTKNVPPYYSYDGTNEEHFTPFVHGSSDDVLNNSGNKVKPTIVDNKLNFKMPANNVTINIAYSINQYTVTFNHIDAVLGTSTIGGQNYNSNSYKLFNGESVNIPYKEIPNFKIVSHNKVTQTNYLLNEHNDKTIDIKYQQINFNVTYDSNGGTACATVQKEYKKNFGTLCTTTRKGYTFAGWYLDGTKITSDTINNTYDDITLRANWTANEYQITYHMGNGTSTQGHTVLGTKTCVFDQTCTLDTFASLNKPFLYSSDPNYGWKFAGWTNFENTMEVKYANGLSFTYDKDYNLDLYAMGKRSLNINRGIAPTTYTALEQYWNPYSTSTDYLTNITLPTSTAIGNGWVFRGYKGGSTESDITAVTFTSDKAGTTFKANYNVYPQIRSIYERTLTMKYNGNGSTGGSTANQTTTQYYSSGYASSNKNNKEQISNPTITLKANGFTKTGYTFKNWAKGSASGTKYNASTSYTFAPGVSETNEETMYAIWDGNTYYVAYDCNGGTGTMSKSEHKYDVAKQLSASACKKGGSVFAKWNTKADNTGTSYTNQQSVKNLTSEQSMNVTLYAQYSMCAAGTYAAAGAATCTSCPTGYTSNAGASSCSKINYTVTIARNNTNYGTVSLSTISIPYGTTYSVNGNTLTFSNGTTVTATPTVATGYTTKFSSWSSTSGTISGPITITANFTRTSDSLALISGSGIRSGYFSSGARNTEVYVHSTYVESIYDGGNGSTSDFGWSSVNVNGYSKMSFYVYMEGVSARGGATFSVGSKSIDVTESGTYTVNISGSGNQRIWFDTYEVDYMSVSSWKLLP